MRERAITFGSGHTLVGVVNEPEMGDPGGELPTVVFLNAGLLNRSGPHRLYVTLARALAEVGFPTLRFDHAGLGDSDGRADQLPYAAGVISDTMEAMDFMAESFDSRRFLLAGLCSGADHSFLTACQDERVEGGVLLDWYAYRTAGYYLRHYGPRVLRVGPWIRTMGKAVRRMGVPLLDAPQRQVDPYAREIPPARDVGMELQALLERGCRFLCVYTRGQDAIFNHQEQFFRMFRGLEPTDGVKVEYLPKADHTFPLLENRRALVELVLGWAEDLKVETRRPVPLPSPV